MKQKAILVENKKKAVAVPTITKPSLSKKDLKKRFEEEEKVSKENATEKSGTNKRKKEQDTGPNKASKTGENDLS